MLALVLVLLTAAAVFANDKLVEFFDTSNEMAMRMRIGIILSIQVSGTVELAPTVVKE